MTGDLRRDWGPTHRERTPNESLIRTPPLRGFAVRASGSHGSTPKPRPVGLSTHRGDRCPVGFFGHGVPSRSSFCSAGAEDVDAFSAVSGDVRAGSKGQGGGHCPTRKSGFALLLRQTDPYRGALAIFDRGALLLRSARDLPVEGAWTMGRPLLCCLSLRLRLRLFAPRLGLGCSVPGDPRPAVV